MKNICRLITMVALSCCCVSHITAKKITVKLFKTDQGTWERPFSYALKATKHTYQKNLLTGSVKQGESEKTSSYKNIRKDGTISFDPIDPISILRVCTGANGKGTCHELDLRQHRIFDDMVVGIDKRGVPDNMSMNQVTSLINQSKFPVLHPIAVYKRKKDKKKTTIRVVQSENGVADEDVVYNQITITEDTTGPFTKKLQVPLDREFFVVVDNSAPQKFMPVPRGTIFNIEENKTITTEDEEDRKRRDEQTAKLQEEKAARDVKVAQEKAQEAEGKKLKAARDVLRKERSDLIKQEALVQGALARIGTGLLNATDKIAIEKMLKAQESVKKSLLDTLGEDPDNSATIDRIKMTEQLSYGDYVRVKPLLLPALKELREKELEGIQAKIEKIERELEAGVLPLSGVTHIRFEQED